MHFAEHASGFHIGQHPLQAAYVCCQLVHVAQALVHLRQHAGDIAEALGQAGFQRRVQLLVDGGTHLFELGGVVGLQGLQLLFKRAAQFAEALLVALGQTTNRQADGVGMALLLLRKLCARLARVFAQRGAQRIQPVVGALGQFIQTLVGTRGHRLQLATEPVTALALLQREAVHLRAQLAATGTLFLAQHFAQAVIGATKQQCQQQAEDDQHGQQQHDQ